MKRVIEEFHVTPVPSFLSREVFSRVTNAQAKLLFFSLSLRGYLDREIGKQELEQSRKSCLEALAAVFQATS
jgi:hypothetical protein